MCKVLRLEFGLKIEWRLEHKLRTGICAVHGINIPSVNQATAGSPV